MKMVKERTRTMPAVNDKRLQVLPSKVIWDGIIDRLKYLETMLKVIMDKLVLVICFIQAYRRLIWKGVLTYVDFLDEIPSASQIKKDGSALYGALLSACQSGVGRRILMENKDKQDGVCSWCQLAQQYETDGNRNVRIKRLESVIDTVFHRNYRGGLFKCIQDFEDAFTELALLGQKTWNDDEIIKCRFVQNAQNIGLVDTVFDELFSDKSFIETCNFLRTHAIRLDQQYKEKAARQIHNTSQLSNRAKKD
jgi:hypothetical protein